MVVVLGCGAIGLDMLQCLRAAGVRDVICVARYPFQAEVAQHLGAAEAICLDDAPDAVAAVNTLARGVDQIYECVGGKADTVQQAIDICKPGGKVIMLGFFSGVRPINLSTVFLKELRILAADGYSTWGSRREFGVALKMLAAHQVDHSSIITHRFTRANWRDGFAAAFNKHDYESIKVLLEAG